MSKICIIVPCYNEENRLPVDSFLAFVQNNNTVHFHFVNDGSTDGTLEVLKGLCSISQLSFSELQKNEGKAEAVRSGILHALNQRKFDYIGYFDADLSAPLIAIDNLIEILENNNNYKMAIGSRIMRMGSKIVRNNNRHYAGRILATLAGWIIKLPVYDTQCGAKLFTAELTKQLFEQPFITKWLFDVELFARILKIYGFEEASQMIYELPLSEWIERGNSKLKLSDFFKTPFDLLRIRNHYR